MDHIVYTDAKARELEKLLAGEKTMIVRGATGRKLPYGRVQAGDCLYFIRNNSEGMVCARSTVSRVFHSDKLSTDQAADLLKNNQPNLNLTPDQVQRWAGKRYLVLVEVAEVQAIMPFTIDRSAYGNMDDWLIVEKIENGKIYNHR